MTGSRRWPTSKRVAPRPRRRWAATSGSRSTAAGKLDARARVDRLLDDGTFREFGTLVGGEIPSDGIVTGSGRVDGRAVMVGAEDFTTLAGTIAGGSNAKRYRLAELALQSKVPLIMLLEGAATARLLAGTAGRRPTC